MTISKATSSILDQLIDVIKQMSSEDYIRPLEIYNGSTIGKHFRHIHDFYSCLIQGSRIGCIDYCQRDRNEALELQPEEISMSFSNMKEDIASLDTSKDIDIYGDFEYMNGTRPMATSSIGRELLYAYDHAVHHLAIIKLGIKAEIPDVEIDSNIGVAASTLRHQLSQG